MTQEAQRTKQKTEHRLKEGVGKLFRFCMVKLEKKLLKAAEK